MPRCSFSSTAVRSLALGAAFVLAGCSGSLDPEPAALTIYGAASTGPALSASVPGFSRSAADSGPPAVQTGAPSSILITLYAMWISENADCSNPVLVQDLGAEGADKDFIENPVLFQGSPPTGTYGCLMLKMSDVLRMRPATSFGGCAAGVQYSGDIYREGEDDWKDAHLNQIVGSGTEEAPVNDRVTIFFSTNPEAALARGISPHQMVLLESELIVPGQSTFHLDASEAVQTDGSYCGLEPPRASFR